jgi:hypothetical protein
MIILIENGISLLQRKSYVCVDVSSTGGRGTCGPVSLRENNKDEHVPSWCGFGQNKR